MRRWSLVVALLFPLSLAGCGGVEGDDALDDSGEASFAEDLSSTFAYTCYCLSERSVGKAGCGPRGPKTMKVSVSKKKVKAKGANSDGPAEDGSYAFDAGYHGRGSNAKYLRYTGNPHNLLIEEPLVSGGYLLNNGGHGGFLQYTYTGDVYENVLYICKR